MTFSTFIIFLLIVGASYRRAVVVDSGKAETFISEVTKGFLIVFSIFAFIQLIPEIGDAMAGKAHQAVTEGVPLAIVIMWLFAPWFYVAKRIRDDASAGEVLGWVLVASSLNIVVAGIVKTFG